MKSIVVIVVKDETAREKKIQFSPSSFAYKSNRILDGTNLEGKKPEIYAKAFTHILYISQFSIHLHITHKCVYTTH